MKLPVILSAGRRERPTPREVPEPFLGTLYLWWPYLWGSLSKVFLQWAEQKKKDFPSCSDLNFAFVSSTFIPQIGSLCTLPLLLTWLTAYFSVLLYKIELERRWKN